MLDSQKAGADGDFGGHLGGDQLHLSGLEVGPREPPAGEALHPHHPTADLALAKRIARTVRESNGGLPAVQALGMLTDNPDVVQVSMNLLDTATTPLLVVYDTVRDLAAAAGVEVFESELVGLLPLDVLVATMRTRTKMRRLEASQIVEGRLLQALSAAEPPPGAAGQAGA